MFVNSTFYIRVSALFTRFVFESVIVWFFIGTFSYMGSTDGVLSEITKFNHQWFVVNITGPRSFAILTGFRIVHHLLDAVVDVSVLTLKKCSNKIKFTRSQLIAASRLTSVWTMFIRCWRNLYTVPKISSFLLSLICCNSMSIAINVPVLPTPALKSKYEFSSVIESIFKDGNLPAMNNC